MSRNTSPQGKIGVMLLKDRAVGGGELMLDKRVLPYWNYVNVMPIPDPQSKCWSRCQTLSVLHPVLPGPSPTPTCQHPHHFSCGPYLIPPALLTSTALAAPRQLSLMTARIYACRYTTTLSLRAPRWESLPVAHCSNLLGTAFLAYISTPLPEITYQINYLLSNPCLGVCFRETQTRTS